MLAALLLALIPTGGTIFIDGGHTNSAVPIVLPDAPAGVEHVHLQIEHRLRVRFGWETDGDNLTWWTTDSWISAGWELRNPVARLLSARMSVSGRAGGFCTPFDGVLDFGGTSGDSTWMRPARTERVIVLRVDQLPGLTLGTRARSAWSTFIHWPNVPGFYFGQVVWLNETRWDATLTYEWIP